ncbi:lipoate-protein ligase [Oscillibacter sp. PC13]|uniref:lipoate--protein ligase n=1 Tax=Oscillibacter sp. PC13 TaxID=1855299 RepID=UPI0008E47212|nr:lipoate--protein ligase [Oscillibacter sp. PC13]SFP83988.1 lipoate-protein ligase [Oscillibacter sp. PC13]
MIYLESPSTDPYFNLALEEYVFERMDRRQPYFMLWQNDNTIVVGKYQNTAEEINQRFVEEHGIRVARRLSGGGAVYHDKGNLNFTFIVDQDELEDFNFKVFVQPVIRTLAAFGVKAEFNGRNDIVIDGKKFSGNSQYASRGRLLHHGCIMVDSNLTNVGDALQVREAKFDSKSVKSVRSRVTTINACAPVPISVEEFKTELKAQISQGAAMQSHTWTEEELREVQKLRGEKYATWEWNYGYCADYDMRREMKFPAGLITVYLQVDNGRIQHIQLFGDFFGNGDLKELEAAMVGLPLDDHLQQALEQLHVESYINGIMAADLCQLLLY